MLTCRFLKHLRLSVIILKVIVKSFIHSRYVLILTGINVEKRPKNFASKMPTATFVLQGSPRSMDIKQEELLKAEVFVIRT